MSSLIISSSSRYQYIKRVSTDKEIAEAMLEMQASSKTSLFLEVMVKPGVKPNLGRPKSSPEENKLAFVEKNFGFKLSDVFSSGGASDAVRGGEKKMAA